MNCYSCGKEMWPEKYNGLIAIVDGDPRCAQCKAENKMWLEEYRKTK